MTLTDIKYLWEFDIWALRSVFRYRLMCRVGGDTGVYCTVKLNACGEHKVITHTEMRGEAGKRRETRG